MLAISHPMPVELNTVLEKEEIAEILHEDISQTLAAVLLMLQSIKEEETLAGNEHFQLAESCLRIAIQKLARMHKRLLTAS